MNESLSKLRRASPTISVVSGAFGVLILPIPFIGFLSFLFSAPAVAFALIGREQDKKRSLIGGVLGIIPFAIAILFVVAYWAYAVFFETA